MGPLPPHSCSRDGVACCWQPLCHSPGAREATAKAHTSATPSGYSIPANVLLRVLSRGLTLDRALQGSRAVLLELLLLWCSISSTPAFPGLFSVTAVPYHIWLFHVWPEMAFLLMATSPLHTGSWVDDNIMFPCKLCMWSCVLFLVLFHLLWLNWWWNHSGPEYPCTVVNTKF